MRLRAHRVSSLVLPVVLGPAQSARIHSVFKHTVNILGGNDTWLCLHPPEVALHPYAIQIEDSCDRAGRAGVGTVGEDARDPGDGLERGAFLGAGRGECVEVGKGSIVLGRERVRIATTGCEPWNPRLDGLRYGPSAYDPVRGRIARVEMVMDAIRGLRITSEFLRPVMGLARTADSRSCVKALLRARVEGIVAVIEEAWRSRRVEDVTGGMTQALGLGGGLTPAGDDFLTGLLAAARCFSPDDGFTREVFASLEPSLRHWKRNTTLPSFYMLKAALEGCYPQPLSGLIKVLEEGSRERIGEALRRLADVGATSGQDMLAGVVCLQAVLAAGRVTCEACPA